MSFNYSNEIYGIRYGYFIDNKFIIHDEYKFTSTDDPKLSIFKQKYIYFIQHNTTQLYYHFFKSIDCFDNNNNNNNKNDDNDNDNDNDSKFFLWVGIIEDQFIDFLNLVNINQFYLNKNDSYNSLDNLAEIDFIT